MKGKESMIRKFKTEDLDRVMEIWLNTNKKAHFFIAESYWNDNFELVKTMLLKAELYVYEVDNEIEGFIGLNDNNIGGLFVWQSFQSKGIGKQLLDYTKRIKRELVLSVYQKNHNAIKFYKREGFSISLERVEEGTGEKEYLMKWEI